MFRPTLLAAAAALTTATVVATTATAAYPEKPITLVVPTAPGGANDAIARTVGQAMATVLKQPVVVDNRAGANGAIASELVKRAAPDGYTLMLGYIATHAMNPSLQKLRYDPLKDFEAVGMIGSSATLMVVNPEVKARSASEAVALLKAEPDKFTYASAGNGTAPHFAAELFKLSTRTQIIHVPYKGSSPAINDTIGGQTQFMFPSLFTALPYVSGGKLVALGVAGTKRSQLMPDVPTLAEQGIADVDVSQWYGIFAPARTPATVMERLGGALKEALADKAVVKRLEDHGAEVESLSGPELREHVRKELEKWRGVVQAARLSAD